MFVGAGWVRKSDGSRDTCSRRGALAAVDRRAVTADPSTQEGHSAKGCRPIPWACGRPCGMLELGRARLGGCCDHEHSGVAGRSATERERLQRPANHTEASATAPSPLSACCLPPPCKPNRALASHPNTTTGSARPSISTSSIGSVVDRTGASTEVAFQGSRKPPPPRACT